MTFFNSSGGREGHDAQSPFCHPPHSRFRSHPKWDCALKLRLKSVTVPHLHACCPYHPWQYLCSVYPPDTGTSGVAGHRIDQEVQAPTRATRCDRHGRGGPRTWHAPGAWVMISVSNEAIQPSDAMQPSLSPCWCCRAVFLTHGCMVG